MSYPHPNLNLTNPKKGYTHFVVYAEPQIGVAGAAWNATISIEGNTPYVREWLSGLQRCEPNPLHTMLVDNQEIPTLFHPCVDEDTNSPSAVAGVGCICRRTWCDPTFGLPVVGRHHRTRSGDFDRWTYTTYAPLDLRPDDVLACVVIDRGNLFWARTTTDMLVFLPQLGKRGYNAGPFAGDGGAAAFAAYLQQLIDTEGQDTAAHHHRYDDPDPRILAWVRSTAAAESPELTLKDLKAIQRG